MPYQTLPGIIIMIGAITTMGVGLGWVTRSQARSNGQSKLQLLTEWDRMMDARDRKLWEREEENRNS
uniref:AlNc14C86G5520 protein n=1 Tax=Albugo laibachii Nc14 TaxID=890382 RepID=F0WFY7_9STRA|nr:AlNc14C86G5520 [Albugo laibachii Nc14]|eukprot:CCA20121.1 AlNc14C86G5520 [Albugo laibachii Nc14]